MALEFFELLLEELLVERLALGSLGRHVGDHFDVPVELLNVRIQEVDHRRMCLGRFFRFGAKHHGSVFAEVVDEL